MYAAGENSIEINRSKITSWNLIFRYTSIILSLVQGLLLVPLYLRFIPIDIYSIWLATGNLLAWISTLDPGLTLVLQQQVADAYGQRNQNKVRKLIGSGFVYILSVLILIIFFSSVLFHYLPSLLKIESGNNSQIIMEAFIFALIGTALMICSFGISSINTGLQGSIAVGIINNTMTLFSIVFTIILLFNGFGLLSLAYNIVLRGFCNLLFHSLYLLFKVQKEKIGLTFDIQNILSLGNLLSYTFFGRVTGILANNIDLVVISRILGPENVSILALTRKSCDITKELINQPSVAFQPAISHAKGEGNNKNLKIILMRLITILIWLLFFVVGGLIIFNKTFVSLWVGIQFYAGNSINVFICIAIIFNITNNCLSQICFALGNIKRTSLIVALQSLIFIPTVIYGTKHFGLLGTVLSSILPLLLISFWYFPILFYRSAKLSKFDAKQIAKEILISISTMISFVFLFSFASQNNLMEFILFIGVYCLGYVFFLNYFSITFKNELKILYKKVIKTL